MTAAAKAKSSSTAPHVRGINFASAELLRRVTGLAAARGVTRSALLRGLMERELREAAEQGKNEEPKRAAAAE